MEETLSHRYFLLYRGQLLVFAGYCIVTLETLFAIWLGLTPISYRTTIAISSCVLAVTVILFIIIKVKRKLLLWQEWLIFGIDLLFYTFFLCLWIYNLGNLRILGLFSSLIAITIVLSYTNIYQSILMSTMTLISYFSVSYYAIKCAGQAGSIIRESFLAFCFFPAYIIIAITANGLDKQRRKLCRAKKKFELSNIELRNLNDALKYEQTLTEFELNLAHDIQSSLFPGKPPVLTDWDIAFISEPKSGVSGDFYDFYCTGDRLEGVALFDVSGHGVASGLITILSKPVLYRNFKKNTAGRLEVILDETNDELTEQLENVNIYITGILLRMSGNCVEYANAGHPDLLHYQCAERSVRTVADSDDEFKGKPIGIPIRDFHYTSLKFNVMPGDVLLLFSDCILESRNKDEVQFGKNRIADALNETAGMNAREVLEHILGKLYAFIDKEILIDDLTIIAAKKL